MTSAADKKVAYSAVTWAAQKERMIDGLINAYYDAITAEVQESGGIRPKDAVRVDDETMSSIVEEQMRLKRVTGKRVSYTKLIKQAWRLYEAFREHSDDIESASLYLAQRKAEAAKKIPTPTELIGPIDLSTLGLTDEEMQALEEKATRQGVSPEMYARIVLTRDVNDRSDSALVANEEDKADATLALSAVREPVDDLELAFSNLFKHISRRRRTKAASEK